VRVVETSSLWGLRRKNTLLTCEECGGSGKVVLLPQCSFCDGRGLIGNESEICRACNGTGRIDSFALVPRTLLRPGVSFERRCDRCVGDTFEIVSAIESRKIVRSWEADESLRHVEAIECVKVKCGRCGNNYEIQLGSELHDEVPADLVAELEELGLNLSFLYQGGSNRRSASPDLRQA
jgi:hypothetical protein